MATAQVTQIAGLQDNYSLSFSIGGIPFQLAPQNFKSLDVIEYIDRFLPAFTITLKDASGVLANNMLNDETYGQVEIQFASAYNLQMTKDMTFRVYRKKSEGHTDQSNNIMLDGLLDVKNLFAPEYQRGWANVPISKILLDIGGSMEIPNYDYDPSMSAFTSIVQPRWANSLFLRWLADRLELATGEGGFFVFIDASVASDVNPRGAPRLTFRSINSFLKQTPTKTLSFDKISTSDILPIINHEVVDNNIVYNLIAPAQQPFTYFDYELGEQIEDEADVGDDSMTALSNYISFDPYLNQEGTCIDDIGRTTEFNPTYTPVIQGIVNKNANSILGLWVNTLGFTDIRCGDIVKCVTISDSDQMANHQFTGNWMVARIVHHLDNTYITRLLLVRPGIDTSLDTSLLRGSLAGLSL
jgi:hypothetical protein